LSVHFKLCMVAIHVYIHDQDHAQCDFCKYLREIIVTFLMSADMFEFAHSQILGYILHTIDGPLSFTFLLVGCSWLGGTINRGKLYHILKTGLVIGRCQVSVSITIHSQSSDDLGWSKQHHGNRINWRN